jgi:hypothetical protein
MIDSEHKNPWRMPNKVKGVKQVAIRSWRDPDFHRVLTERAALETKLLTEAKEAGTYFGPVTISPETIVINMVLYPTTFTRVVSEQLRGRYQQLKKENQGNVKTYMDIKGGKAKQSH